MKLKAVRGTRDILPGEVERWRRVEERARATFELYGFQEIRTPVFEHAAVFEKGTGEASDIVQKEMYRFTDLGGNELTLRPEGTPPVVRAYIEHKLRDAGSALRYYYIGPMFRYERPQKGRYRQFHQIGIELFGSQSPIADAEVIAAGMHWLESLGASGLRLLVNSVGDDVCRPLYREALVAAQRERLDELCSDCQRRHETNPLRVLDCKKEECRAVVADLPTIDGYLCSDCQSHLAGVTGYLERWGVVHAVEARLVRGLDYYRRTVFEITSDALGAQDSVLGGGRYDGLVERMGGQEVPAVGFAAGVERILLALPEGLPDPPADLFVVTFDDSVLTYATDLVHGLRHRGVRCVLDVEGRSMRAQMRAANRLGIPAVVVIGPDEIESGTLRVKSMVDGNQEETSREGIAEAVARVLDRRRHEKDDSTDA